MRGRGYPIQGRRDKPRCEVRPEMGDWRDKAATLAIAAPREKCTD